MARPSWEEYFMRNARLAADMTTCLRRKVGAVVVIKKRIIATGFNGAPPGTSHCDKVGCLRQRLNIPSGERAEVCRGIHAEQNCIIQSSLYGASLAGGTMYTTTTPCLICAKMIIGAQIKTIVFEGEYSEKLGMDMFEEAGVEMIPYEKPGESEGQKP